MTGHAPFLESEEEMTLNSDRARLQKFKEQWCSETGAYMHEDMDWIAARLTAALDVVEAAHYAQRMFELPKDGSLDKALRRYEEGAEK